MIGGFSNTVDVLNFFSYIDAQNKGLIARTIYYIDILAVTSENVEYVKEICNKIEN
jgi:hypothetical protein